jgi:hypothetical protein
MLHAGCSFITRARTFATTVLLGAGIVVGCRDASPTAANTDALSVELAINGVSGESVVIDPRNATLRVGYGAIVQARITDAAGNPVSGVRPTWSSTSPSIATVSVLPDSAQSSDGLRAALSARSAGVTAIIVAYNGKADTARFTITTGDSVTPGPGPFTGPRPTRFDVTGRVSQHWIDSLVLRDSTYVGQIIAGVTVRFVQLPSAPGDTLTSSVPPVTTPTVLATAITDNAGTVTFRDMPAARYRLEVQTPAESEWGSRTFDFGPPLRTPLHHELRVIKKIYQ